MGQTVQFFGTKNVVKAYMNMDCPSWSILQGRQFQFKYEGDSITEGATFLEQLLESIHEGVGSKAIYTIRVYAKDTLKRNKDGKAKVFESSPYDGSFNFRLIAEEEEEDRRSSRSYRQEIEQLKETVRTLAEKVDNEHEEEEEDSEVSGIAGIIKGLMAEPQVKQVIIGKVVQLAQSLGDQIGNVFKMKQPSIPAKIAGPEDQATATAIAEETSSGSVPVQMDQEEVNKLNQALTTLARIDPQLGSHLMKVADIARRDPGKYKMFISML